MDLGQRQHGNIIGQWRQFLSRQLGGIHHDQDVVEAAFDAANTKFSSAGGTVSGAVVTYAATFAAGTGTGSLIEAGIFNSATAASGTMLCKTSFDVVNKAANDSIAITWTVTIQ